MRGFLAAILDFIGEILIVLIVVRAFVSWIRPRSYSRTYGEFVRFLDDVTEPVMAPIRRIMPDTGMFDFSPMAAVVVIYIAIQLVNWILR